MNSGQHKLVLIGEFECAQTDNFDVMNEKYNGKTGPMVKVWKCTVCGVEMWDGVHRLFTCKHGLSTAQLN